MQIRKYKNEESTQDRMKSQEPGERRKRKRSMVGSKRNMYKEIKE